jgi:mannose/fructose/N-acetylgalactosamine-specific phosphotransferase system component IIB
MNKFSHTFVIRIDDRLIHGQVIVGWVKNLNLKNIIVVNDDLVNDPIKLQMTKLAIPSEINVEFLTIEDAAKLCKNNAWQNSNTIILVESPKDAYNLIDKVVNIDEINVVLLHIKNNRKQITDNIAINDEDKEYLEKLIKLNIKLEGRALPKDEAYDLEKVLGKNKNGLS